MRMELNLHGLNMSKHSLSSISRCNTFTLNALELTSVRLKSDTWESLLPEFYDLSHLERFRMEFCGHAFDGDYRHLIRLCADINPILPLNCMEEHREIRSSGHLQRHVNNIRKKKGLKPFTDNDCCYLEQKPQESLDGKFQ